MDTRRLMVARERRDVSTGYHGRVLLEQLFHWQWVLALRVRQRVAWLRAKGAPESRATDENRWRMPHGCISGRGYTRARSGIPGRRAVEGVRNWSWAKASCPEVEMRRCGYARSAPANLPAPSAVAHCRSSGLRTPSAPRFSTCKYTIVVLTSAWPSSSCTVRMS